MATTDKPSGMGSQKLTSEAVT